MELLRKTFKEQLTIWHEKRDIHQQKVKELAEAPWKDQ